MTDWWSGALFWQRYNPFRTKTIFMVRVRVGTGRVFEKRVGSGHTKALAGWVGSDPLPKRRVGLTRRVDPCGSTRRVKLTGQRFISALQNKKISFSIILLFLKYFSFIIILFTIQEKKMHGIIFSNFLPKFRKKSKSFFAGQKLKTG